MLNPAPRRPGRVCLNEDNNHFFCSHPESDMTDEGADRLVDAYARSKSLGALFFNPNVKRAHFPSRTWEAIHHGYDPDGPTDQPSLRWLPPERRDFSPGSARWWPHNIWRLEQRGVDLYGRWLARSRHHSIEGWLSVRMNDWHANDILDAYWHPDFWREHPEYWRRPYRYEWWTDRQYDYAQEAVRNHHLAFIGELFERFDCDGVELDWCRNPHGFRPGSEQAGLALLTDFMQTVRRMADAAAARTGHPVRVGIRVPEDPQTCRRMGFDVVAWIRRKLVDHVVASVFVNALSMDPPIESWLDETRPAGIPLGLAFMTGTFTPFHSAPGRKGCMPVTREMVRGAALAAYHRGVDRVYLFNYCYWEGGKADRTSELLDWMDELGDPARLAQLPRRHPIGYREVVAPGEPEASLLPQSFLNGPGAASRYGHGTATFCPVIGPAPANGQTATVILGFARDVEPPANPPDLEVRVNGIVCPPANDSGFPREFPELVDKRGVFSIPTGVLHNGRNAVECFSESRRGVIVWAEIAITGK